MFPNKNYIVALIAASIILLIWRYMCKPVYWFFRESCPYCIQMKDEWVQFKYMTTISMILPIDIDITTLDGQAMSKIYGVSSVPTLIKIDDGRPSIYDGDRNALDIYLWATKY